MCAKKYGDLSFIPPTSNIVERLFSKSKLILGDLRRSMLPQHLEYVLLLSVNRELWDATTVGEIMEDGDIADVEVEVA